MSEVCVVRDAGEASQLAAGLFVEATAGAAAARGQALVALTGGSSAPGLYAALREDRWRARVPWERVHLLTGDERCVPEADPRSNWGVAARELLPHVPLPEGHRHRMRGEAEPAAEARRYAAGLRALAGTPPRLDLVLLGLGSDGHVLSLFAGVPGSTERGDEELVRAVAAPLALDPRVPRLSFTPFLLVTARLVVLATAGAAKAKVLAQALEGREDLLACPAQWLRRASGRVVVVADAAAASALSAGS